MSRTFTKLFSSITESTVWCEPDRTRIVWIALLAMADRHGRVFASIPGLANRARVPVDDAETAINTFMSPDKYSRTPDFEGRRIEPIDGGWRLLNHEKYREIRDEESIKESKRNYINARRAKEREGVEKSRTESNAVERSRANAEADTEAEAEAYTEAESVAVKPSSPNGEVTAALPLAVAKKQRKAKEPAPTASTWKAYADAYEGRYGTKPVRNAQVNALLAQLVSRLGADEAPAVAQFYVGHQKAFYVGQSHPVSVLVKDCEGLRTQWASGRSVMAKDANEADRVAADGGMWKRISDSYKDKAA